MLRVASYNVHRCIGTDGRFDPVRVAQVLASIDPDVAALQEIDTGLRMWNGIDPLDFLARAGGMRPVEGPAVEHSWGFFGNAILTRRRITGSRRIDLTLPGREPRCAMAVDIEIGAGRTLRVIAAHLGLAGAERAHQVSRLLAEVEGVPEDVPLVVLGDFNEWRPRATLRHLDSCLGRSFAVPSFPSGIPFLALDRIWVRPHAALLSVQVRRTPLARVASDHLPVEAVLDL